MFYLKTTLVFFLFLLAPSISAESESVLLMDSFGCDMNCPHYSLIITGRGQVFYRQAYSYQGMKRKQISPARLRGLRSILRSAKIRNGKEKHYGFISSRGTMTSIGHSRRIHIRFIDGKIFSSVYYSPDTYPSYRNEAPAHLFLLEQKILKHLRLLGWWKELTKES